MNNISWRFVSKGRVWYWEREDTFNVLRTGPFSSYSACAADAKANGLDPKKVSKTKRQPARRYESVGKQTSNQQRAN